MTYNVWSWTVYHTLCLSFTAVRESPVRRRRLSLEALSPSRQVAADVTADDDQSGTFNDNI